MTKNKQGDGDPSARPSHLKPSTMRLRARRGPAQMPHLLSVDEVAKILRTTRKGVYALIAKDGLGGVVRVGRRILVDSYELQEWIDTQRVRQPPLLLPGRRR